MKRVGNTVYLMNARTIYIVDRVVTRPGSTKDFIGAYLNEYAPGAVDRGLTLDRVLVSPPVWIEDEGHTVTVTWTVAGPQEWWRSAVNGRHDPVPSQWWETVDPLIFERTRSMAADADDIEGLCDV